jgi:hypothetical protein
MTGLIICAMVEKLHVAVVISSISHGGWLRGDGEGGNLTISSLPTWSPVGLGIVLRELGLWFAGGPLKKSDSMSGATKQRGNKMGKRILCGAFREFTP